MAPADGHAHDDLVARLTLLARLRDVPREQLEWLAARAWVRHHPAGTVLLQANQAIDSMWLVLSGHIVIFVDRGAGPRKTLEWRAGDISGVLPYSRLRTSPGRVVVEEAAEIVGMPATHFPDMIRDCHELTAACVHVMLERARHFTSTDLHEEKMLSLGKLAAGLAHELNNPASAAARSADELVRGVMDLETSAIALGGAGLPPAGYDAIARVRRRHLTTRSQVSRSPIEQADWEDEIEAWLDAHGLPATAADPLADSSVTLEALDLLASELTPSQLKTAVSWFVAGHSARRLAGDIEIATARIYSLVAAVKGFTYMDQGAAPQPVNVGHGLADTITVLRTKANAKSITLRLEVAPGLPKVIGYGGELNQVWSNLIDNALDAVDKGGHISVTVRQRGEHLVVCVTDDGPGIPGDITARIFDPFFTTKAPGSGTGLGLDIVRRLVQRNGGDVEVDSEPGRTAFRVMLPTPVVA